MYYQQSYLNFRMATDKSNYKNDKMTDEPLLKVLDVIPKAPCVLLFVSRMKSYEFSDFMISAEERRKRKREEKEEITTYLQSTT